jgi:hypothetical protein
MILLNEFSKSFYMADLNVQPKKRTPVWPWILLVLIIAVVAYFLLRDKGVVPDVTDSDSTEVRSADTSTQYRTDTTTDTMQVR